VLRVLSHIFLDKELCLLACEAIGQATWRRRVFVASKGLRIEHASRKAAYPHTAYLSRFLVAASTGGMKHGTAELCTRGGCDDAERQKDGKSFHLALCSATIAARTASSGDVTGG